MERRDFTEEEKLSVWNKAEIINGYDPAVFRKDPCGAWIIFNKYGFKNTTIDEPFAAQYENCVSAFISRQCDIKTLKMMER